MDSLETPWYRRSIMSAAICLVLVLMGITAARVFSRVYDTDAAQTQAAKVEAMVRFEDSPLQDTDNAARWLEAGAAAMVTSGTEGKAIGDASTTPFAEWSPELVEQIRQTLDRNRGALFTLLNALEPEGSSLEIAYGEGFDMEMPELLPLLRAARLLVAEARLAFAEGDVMRGIDALRVVERMVVALEQERTLITALVGVAADRMLVATATEAAISNQPWAWQEGTLAELEGFASGYGTREMIERVSEAWAVLMCHYVGEGQNLVALKSGETFEFSSDCRCENLQAKVAEVLELVDVPYGAEERRFEALAEGANCGSATKTDLEGFAKTIARAQSVDAQRQLLRALITIRRLGLEKGGYPEARPQINPLLVPDPFTGESLSYTKNPDGSVTLAIVGAVELLEPITVGKAFKTVVPMTLPAPGS